MDTDMSNKQLVRLTSAAVQAIKEYRRDAKRTRKVRLSINTAINDLIIFGWHDEYTPIEREALNDTPD